LVGLEVVWLKTLKDFHLSWRLKIEIRERRIFLMGKDPHCLDIQAKHLPAGAKPSHAFSSAPKLKSVLGRRLGYGNIPGCWSEHMAALIMQPNLLVIAWSAAGELEPIDQKIFASECYLPAPQLATRIRRGERIHQRQARS